jgi:hypothetical protein
MARAGSVRALAHHVQLTSVLISLICSIVHSLPLVDVSHPAAGATSSGPPTEPSTY